MRTGSDVNVIVFGVLNPYVMLLGLREGGAEHTQG